MKAPPKKGKKSGLYKDVKGKWRWRTVGENGRKTGASSESFTRRIDCAENARLVREALIAFQDEPFAL